MDLNYLKKNAPKFAYELRKFFPSSERPIAHYICEEGLLVISTEKTYYFFVETIINYKGDFHNNVIVENVDEENGTFKLNVKKREFNVVFERKVDIKNFIRYYEKYSN